MKKTSKKGKLCPTCGRNLSELAHRLEKFSNLWKEDRKNTLELVRLCRRFYTSLKSISSKDDPLFSVWETFRNARPIPISSVQDGVKRLKNLAGWDDFRTGSWFSIIEFPEATAQQVKRLLTIAA